MDGLARYENLFLERRCLFTESTGASYSSGTGDTSLDLMIRSISEVDDTSGLTTLLQNILVFDPLRRPDVSDLLDHPWFVGSSSPATPSGSASE